MPFVFLLGEVCLAFPFLVDFGTGSSFSIGGILAERVLGAGDLLDLDVDSCASTLAGTADFCAGV